MKRRPNHSLGAALAVGGFLAACTTIGLVTIMAGPARPAPLVDPHSAALRAAPLPRSTGERKGGTSLWRVHDAPLGWSYPPLCCSDRDCRQAGEREVRETPEGYLLVTTGEVVPYLNYRVKPSPDGLFHVCQQAGNFDSGRVLCLFVPPRGF